MKILCGPDLHIRVTTPEHRIDDFVATQKRKIEWVLRLADEYNCLLVLFPGDITDHSRLPYHIVDWYIRSFKSCPFTILAVRGQHDMLYHVESENTPYSVMDAAKAIHSLPNPGFWPKKDYWPAMHNLVRLYGASWDDPIPELEPDPFNRLNILLIHKMFVDDKLWEGQEEYERANIFLNKNKWDLIVSGDNHQHFMFQSKGRFHVNCGSLMRQSIDQKDHSPVVYIYNTEDKTLAPHYVPIDPIEDVMDLDKAEEKKEKDEKMEAFVEKVKEDTEITGLDYVKNLDERLAKEDIKEGVRVAGREIMKNAAEKIIHR